MLYALLYRAARSGRAVAVEPHLFSDGIDGKIIELWIFV